MPLLGGIAVVVLAFVLTIPLPVQVYVALAPAFATLTLNCEPLHAVLGAVIVALGAVLLVPIVTDCPAVQPLLPVAITE